MSLDSARAHVTLCKRNFVTGIVPHVYMHEIGNLHAIFQDVFRREFCEIARMFAECANSMIDFQASHLSEIAAGAALTFTMKLAECLYTFAETAIAAARPAIQVADALRSVISDSQYPQAFEPTLKFWIESFYPVHDSAPFAHIAIHAVVVPGDAIASRDSVLTYIRQTLLPGANGSEGLRNALGQYRRYAEFKYRILSVTPTSLTTKAGRTSPLMRSESRGSWFAIYTFHDQTHSDSTYYLAAALFSKELANLNIVSLSEKRDESFDPIDAELTFGEAIYRAAQVFEVCFGDLGLIPHSGEGLARQDEP